MDERNSINHVQITIDLPADVADVLATHGEAMISAMVAIAKTCRLNPSEQNRIEAKERRKESLAENLAQIIKLGRIGYRYMRSNPDVQSIGALATELGVTGQKLRFATDHFKKKFKAKLKKRRDREIVRYARKGVFNDEIAHRIGVHRNTISKVLEVERKRMAESSQRLRIPHPIQKQGGDV